VLKRGDREIVKVERVNGKRLTILKAEYGCGKRWFDVTPHLQDAVRKNRLYVTAGNFAGNPAPGVRSKRLRITYRFGDGRPLQAEALMGEAIVLTKEEAPQTDGFLILEAVYGAGVKWQDITAAVRELSEKSRLRVATSAIRVGDGQAILTGQSHASHIIIRYAHQRKQHILDIRRRGLISIPTTGEDVWKDLTSFPVASERHYVNKPVGDYFGINSLPQLGQRALAHIDQQRKLYSKNGKWILTHPGPSKPGEPPPAEIVYRFDKPVYGFRAIVAVVGPGHVRLRIYADDAMVKNEHISGAGRAKRVEFKGKPFAKLRLEVDALRNRGGDFTLFADPEVLVDITRGGLISIPDCDRQVAEWALGIGGTVSVLTDSGEVEVANTEDLPSQVFAIKTIDLATSPLVNDETLESLEGLTSLRRLDLDSTKITDAGLVHLKEVKELRTLILAATKVSDAGLEHLKGLANLTLLNLSGTEVTADGITALRAVLPHCRIDINPDVTRATGKEPKNEVASESMDPNRRAAEWVLGIRGELRISADDHEREAANIADLPGGELAVVAVYLAGNRSATDEALENCQGLTSLRILDLTSTGVTDAGLAYFKESTGLESLHLLGTQVTDDGLETLKGMTGLRLGLNLAGTQVTDRGLENLERMTGLQVLDLSRTAVTDAGIERLKGLTALRRLHLASTGVTDAGLEIVKGFTRLEVLELCNTEVGDRGLEHLAGRNTLQIVRLDSTEVTDVGFEHLAQLTELEELYLRRTRVSVAGVAKLQAALPHCQIIR